MGGRVTGLAMIDPSKFFALLKQVEESSASAVQTAIKNVDLFMDGLALLQREVRVTNHGIAELRETFQSLTGQKGDQELQQFKSEHKDNIYMGGTLKVITPVHVHKDKGSVSSHSWAELRAMGMIKPDPDSANDRVTGHVCWCWPFDCMPWLFRGSDERDQIAFLSGLRFNIITTDNDDQFDMYLIFDGQMIKRHMLSVALLRGPNGHPATKKLALNAGVSPQCHEVIYKPLGDNVPISKNQTFIFNSEILADVLDTLPRPSLLNSAGGQCEQRAMDLAKALQVVIE